MTRPAPAPYPLLDFALAKRSERARGFRIHVWQGDGATWIQEHHLRSDPDAKYIHACDRVVLAWLAGAMSVEVHRTRSDGLLGLHVSHVYPEALRAHGFELVLDAVAMGAVELAQWAKRAGVDR